MKIAIAQVDCTPGDIASNCAQIPAFAERARERHCEVIVFPEMTDTGYEMTAVKKSASQWTESPFNIARRSAADFGVYLICGLSEREEEKIYNSIVVFDPNGNVIGKYRKTHLFSPDPVNEDRYITRGKRLETVSIGGMIWGLQICYDLRFPEVSRYLGRGGAEVLVVCSAWPFPRKSHWNILTAARAIDNQVYVIGANRIGSDGPLTFCGSSCVIDPRGIVMASGSVDQEELLVSNIDREIVVSLRDRFPVLNDRREDWYKSWE